MYLSSDKSTNYGKNEQKNSYKMQKVRHRTEIPTKLF